MADDSGHANVGADNLLQAHVAIDKLYRYRDRYHIEHDTCERKSEDVNSKLQQTLATIDELERSDAQIDSNNAQWSYVRGRALNVLPDFNITAFELLTKSVKIDPNNVDAWNELGEAFWKKGDLEGAKNSFESSLNHRRNKVALRSLSMIMRQVASKVKDQRSARQPHNESLKLAKEAVTMDATDGMSWYILGNAFLSMFFSCGQDENFLRQSLSAYIQAERCDSDHSNVDLYLNRAVLFRYSEEYSKAIGDLELASRIESGSGRQQLDALSKHLLALSDAVENCGGLKAKKVREMMSSLSSEGHLGPFGGGKYVGTLGLELSLRQSSVEALQAGANKEKVVLGRVLFTALPDDGVPLSVVLLDRLDARPVVVNIFNLAAGRHTIKVGDAIAIAEPYLKHIAVNIAQRQLAFNLIRVNSPLMLVVNRHKYGTDKHADIVCSAENVAN